jgi:YHS domain-containing protein/uncharacterized membrane protein YraQ (UPF0718 family)
MLLATTTALGIWQGVLGRCVREALAMLYETFWPLVLGFSLSGMVQAFVSRAQMERSFGDLSPKSATMATAIGAISSSCSYAASSMAHALWRRGANLVTALIFMVASTNLVIELGVVLVVLMGWQFAVGEFVGGAVMIALLALLGARLLATAQAPVASPSGGQASSPESSARTLRGWADAASYTVADLTMLRKELVAGFAIAGVLAAAVPNGVWNVVFLRGHGAWTTLENALVGPLVAVASFVCSIGNVPLAAALWHGGISFGGVLAFLFADLITLPLLLIYRRYYGGALAFRIFLVFWAAMSIAGLLTGLVFTGLHLAPTSHTTAAMAGGHHVRFDTTGVLNLVAAVVLCGIVVLARLRTKLGGGEGYAIDPVCGMQVQTAHASATAAHEGTTFYFCAERCRDRFVATPARFLDGPPVGHDEGHGGDASSSVDPVCGMTVEVAHAAATVDHEGTTYAFCNLGCRDRFVADPSGVLAAGPQGMPAAPAPITLTRRKSN